MERQTISTSYSEDNILDLSTAPTTPDGSLTFSPSLEALRIRDAFDGASENATRKMGRQSPDTILDSPAIRVQNVCCIGAGYVGGPTAAVMAYQNPRLKVTVVDRNASRIAQWKSKHMPLYEPGLREILRIARDGSKAFSFINNSSQHEPSESAASSASSATSECDSQCLEHTEEVHIPARQPNLFFSTEISKSISEADIILVAVNTPTKGRGIGAGRATDVTALEAVTKEIALHARPGAILVEKSTVPCRTAEIIKDMLEIYRPNTPFTILSNPEFLSAGTAISDLMNPSRVLIGCQPTLSGERAASLLRSVYSWVPDSNILTTNTYSSELAKLVANSMLAQRISSINSISAICEQTGADIGEISRAVGLDDRIGEKYLQAGVGFGGSCFGKDIRSLIYLAEGLHLPEVADYWEQVLKMNEWQRTRFVRRVVRCLNGTLVGKKIAVLGYAFKKGTDDTRESPALESITSLLEDTPKEIAVFDPFCDPRVVREEIERLVGVDCLKENGGSVEIYSNAYEACIGSHAVIIMTDCDEFHNSTSLSLKPRAKRNQDPRPFERLVPKESDILVLHKYLVSTTQTEDPLTRFVEESDCDASCAFCLAEREKAAQGQGVQKEKLDWAKIAYHLQKPRWVFDGRGVLDVLEMEKLGCRVESIGRVGWSGL